MGERCGHFMAYHRRYLPRWESVKRIINENLYLSPYAGKGRYNDMDMLEVGRTLSAEEDQTHFAIWCMMSSPLLIGCDLTTLRPATLELLKNTELIALNQDPLGLQAYVAKVLPDGTYVLVKDVEKEGGTRRAVAFYNPTDSASSISIDTKELELAGVTAARDLIAHDEIMIPDGLLSATVPPHGTRVYTISGSLRLPRTTYEAEQAYLGAYQEIYDPIATGTAFYFPMESASGGMVVANVGHTPSNDLQWRDVRVDKEGDYRLDLDVTGKANGNLLLFVNDGAAIKLPVEGEGPRTLSSVVHLHKGTNTVRIASTGSAPYIDRMTVNP